VERPAVRCGLRPPESLTHRREARGFASSPCGRRCTRAGHRAQLPARDGRPRLTVTAPSPWVRARQGAPGRILRKSGDGGDSGVSRGPPPAETLPGAVRQSRHASASRSREACSRSAPDPGMGATRRQLRPGHSHVPHGRRSHRGTWPSRNHRPQRSPCCAQSTKWARKTPSRCWSKAPQIQASECTTSPPQLFVNRPALTTTRKRTSSRHQLTGTSSRSAPAT